MVDGWMDETWERIVSLSLCCAAWQLSVTSRRIDLDVRGLDVVGTEAHKSKVAHKDASENSKRDANVEGHDRQHDLIRNDKSEGVESGLAQEDEVLGQSTVDHRCFPSEKERRR